VAIVQQTPTLGGETIVGKLVLIITRSGNRSADAILMAGLSVTPSEGSGGSDGGCGKHHLYPVFTYQRPRSRRERRADPQKASERDPERDDRA
jgi:hypothetical protein